MSYQDIKSLPPQITDMMYGSSNIPGVYVRRVDPCPKTSATGSTVLFTVSSSSSSIAWLVPNLRVVVVVVSSPSDKSIHKSVRSFVETKGSFHRIGVLPWPHDELGRDGFGSKSKSVVNRSIPRPAECSASRVEIGPVSKENDTILDLDTIVGLQPLPY